MSFGFFFQIFTDDEDRLREELKDLIDDNPIEEDDSDGEDSDGSKKRKKSDEEDFDDRLEDDDYDLIEENLGVKVERVKLFLLDKLFLLFFQELLWQTVICIEKEFFCRNDSNVFEKLKMKNPKRNRNTKWKKRETQLQINYSKVQEM